MFDICLQWTHSRNGRGCKHCHDDQPYCKRYYSKNRIGCWPLFSSKSTHKNCMIDNDHIDYEYYQQNIIPQINDPYSNESETIHIENTYYIPHYEENNASCSNCICSNSGIYTPQECILEKKEAIYTFPEFTPKEEINRSNVSVIKTRETPQHEDTIDNNKEECITEDMPKELLKKNEDSNLKDNLNKEENCVKKSHSTSEISTMMHSFTPASFDSIDITNDETPSKHTDTIDTTSRIKIFKDASCQTLVQFNDTMEIHSSMTPYSRVCAPLPYYYPYNNPQLYYWNPETMNSSTTTPCCTRYNNNNICLDDTRSAIYNCGKRRCLTPVSNYQRKVVNYNIAEGSFDDTSISYNDLKPEKESDYYISMQKPKLYINDDSKYDNTSCHHTSNPCNGDCDTNIHKNNHHHILNPHQHSFDSGVYTPFEFEKNSLFSNKSSNHNKTNPSMRYSSPPFPYAAYDCLEKSQNSYKKHRYSSPIKAERLRKQLESKYKKGTLKLANFPFTKVEELMNCLDVVKHNDKAVYPLNKDIDYNYEVQNKEILNENHQSGAKLFQEVKKIVCLAQNLCQLESEKAK